jgi:uncharacterized membrane protein YukC
MDFWLPYPVTKTNTASIKRDQIIAMLDPSDDFEEYYENALDALEKSRESDSSLEDESEDKLKVLLETLQIPKERFIN